jgi:hypothetical protein
MEDISQTQLRAQARRSSWRRYLLALTGAVAFVLVYRGLKPAADWLTYQRLHLARGAHLGDAVNFFVYDTAKIMLLLVTVIEKIEKLKDIMRFRVLATPALAIDGVVKAAGRLLSTDEIRKLIAAH